MSDAIAAVAPVMQLSGLRALLFWLCVVIGLGSCAMIFYLTIRHHRLRSKAMMRGQADADGEEPVIYDSSLFAEIVWVLIPLLMVLGLGAWALSGGEGEAASQTSSSISRTLSTASHHV